MGFGCPAISKVSTDRKNMDLHEAASKGMPGRPSGRQDVSPEKPVSLCIPRVQLSKMLCP